MTRSSLSLFAYGTLLFPEVMHAVTGQRLTSINAVLGDHYRCSIKNEVYPAVIAQTGASVTGQLYTGLNRNILKILDAFEGVIYTRCNRKVMTANNGIINAQIYMILDEYHHLISDVPWDVDEFKRYHLETYLKKCARFLVKYKRE